VQRAQRQFLRCALLLTKARITPASVRILGESQHRCEIAFEVATPAEPGARYEKAPMRRSSRKAERSRTNRRRSFAQLGERIGHVTDATDSS